MNPERKLRSTHAVAAMLDMSPRHIRRLIASGELRAVRFGKVYRVTGDAIDALLAARAVTPHAGAQS